MANYLTSDRLSTMLEMLKAAKTSRQIQRATRMSPQTIKRYRDLLKLAYVCPCGQDSRHQGWCSYRYQQSPLRQAFIAAWSRTRLGSGKVQIRWPFILSENISEEQAFMLAINEAVPRWLPEEIRADLCQDVAVAVLTGECQVADLSMFVKGYLPKARREYGTRWGHISIDWRDDAGIALKDLLKAPALEPWPKS